VFREHNRVADEMAKRVFPLQPLFSAFNVAPAFVSSLLRVDVKGIWV